MKYPALVLSILLFTSLSLAAQADAKKGPDLSEIISQLQLDQPQADQLSNLVQQHHEQMRAQRKEQKQQRSERHEIRAQHREALLNLLSYEQLYQFEKYMQQKRQQRRQDKPASQTQD